jgi:hypothetical protein
MWLYGHSCCEAWSFDMNYEKHSTTYPHQKGRRYIMPAESPEKICHLFKQYMAAGDVESLVSIYDPEAVFLSQSRELKKGRQGLREELDRFRRRKSYF